jgi:hypothetical protein
LPQVDGNWALSSAVANGGIPQDSSRAWLHVRTIFRDEGANNVAWVWAPADPGHDGVYAPPPSTIDVVAVTMFHYPQTAWGNPATVLRDQSQRYRSTPLFVEVSAAGPPARKASWLRGVGSAVAAMPNVQALLYHEDGPLLLVTANKTTPWSVASDPLALRAMRVAARLAGVRTSVNEKVGTSRR